MIGPNPTGLWILDEHYNKVVSSTKINYPSTAHGVRF
jgi:hypothetical protein